MSTCTLIVTVESMAITYVIDVSFARVVGKILVVPGGLNSRLLFYSFTVRYVVSSHGLNATGLASKVVGRMPQGWRETS